MKNGNIEPKQIDPEKVNYLIINESEFECMANSNNPLLDKSKNQNI